MLMINHGDKDMLKTDMTIMFPLFVWRTFTEEKHGTPQQNFV
jgi:hypothetical protein